jgi:hypothetical protein
MYNIYKASVSPSQVQQIMPYLVAFATAVVYKLERSYA